MKIIIRATFLIVFGVVGLQSRAQSTPLTISLEPIIINELGGLQSYAYGQHNGKWLIVGGRLDGLHRRQPWASFDVAGNNNQLVVIDPVAKKQWKADLTSLPSAIQEQLSSTNMQFYQENGILYCVGGYGYSSAQGDHTTFNNLTAINVKGVIESVINNRSFTNYFRQITDNQFQVTGGRLAKINNTFYLLGGQKFIGRYNPMGPDHGPGFVQEYTNAIRKFKLEDNGTSISITHLNSHLDENNLHRRDYNAGAQIMPDGSEGITMFSGVFQKDVDLPFLNAVNVDSTSYTLINDFKQYYNHYHCPVIPLYSEQKNVMHTLFFGGIAQYYDNNGVLTQDDDVPFVNTIASVTRDENGKMEEIKLNAVMPSLLGAGAEFIPNLDLPHYKNEVFKLDSFISDSVLLGYIYGGIASTQPNIFFINTGTQSSAADQLFKVYLHKYKTTSVNEPIPKHVSNLNLELYPNPSQGIIRLAFNLPKSYDLDITVSSINGVVLSRKKYTNLYVGQNELTLKLPNSSASTYLLTIESPFEKITKKVNIKN